MHEKKIPHDIDSEKAVLGSLLLESDCMNDVINIINSDDFFSDENKSIFTASYRLYNRGEAINQVTVSRELLAMKKLDLVGGAAYLSHLVVECLSPVMVESYARIVKRLSINRKVITLGHNIEQIGYEEIESHELIAKIEAMVLDVQKEVSMPRLITSEEWAKKGIDRYGQLQNGKHAGIYTGFYSLDELLGGIFGGEVCFFAARPGLGKTSWLLDVAKNIGQTGKNILLASLEQSWGDLLDRFVSTELEQSTRTIRLGNYSPEVMGKITMAMAKVSESKIFIYDSGNMLDTNGTTINAIFAVANQMKLAYGLSAILIDYLGLISDDREKAYERVTYISKMMKYKARTLDIPVICICQLNREPERREGHQPVMSDLRDAGTLEQDADIILLGYRPDKYEDEAGNKPQDQFEVTVAKCRQNGEITDAVVPLYWNPKKHVYFDPKQPKQTPEEFR
jgi:replicative DNA helicase